MLSSFYATSFIHFFQRFFLVYAQNSYSLYKCINKVSSVCLFSDVLMETGILPLAIFYKNMVLWRESSLLHEQYCHSSS